MLLRYSINNYASFRDLTTLDFRRPANDSTSGVATDLMHNVMIFGSSGSGKSNLLDALSVVKSLVQGKNVYYSVGQRLLVNWWGNDYSEVCIDFSINSKVYRYYLKIKQQRLSGLNHTNLFTFHIAEEKLSVAIRNYLDDSIPDNVKFETVFHKDNVDAGLLRKVEHSEKTIIAGGYTPLAPRGEDYSEYNLVIKSCNYSAIRYPEVLEWQDDKDVPADHLEHLENMKTWFLQKLRFVGMEDTAFSAFDEAEPEDLAEVLNCFGFDVAEARWETVEYSPELTNEEQELRKKLRKIIKKTESGIYRITYKKATEKLVLVNNCGQQISLSNESEGTRRMVELSEMVIPTDKDITFIVDEVNRKLHPCLTLQLMSLIADDFVSKRQVIVTSHESALLTSKIYTYGEKWYVYKDRRQMSHLYMIPDEVENHDFDLWQLFRDGQIASYFGWEE